MITILAEKASAAQNFATALGGKSGRYNGEEYQIVHAVGHLYQFPKTVSSMVSPEKKDFYDKWKVENLPWNPDDFKWKIQPIKGREKAIADIKVAFENSDEVCIATDNDSTGEGDLLAWEILLALSWKGKTTRMLFDDEKPASVQKAFSSRKEIPQNPAKYGPFVKARSRSKFDYLSMQFTRMASLMAYKRGYRYTVRQGRLKSVMVYLVGEQLEKVKNYVREPYFEARFKDENGNIFKVKESAAKRFKEESEVEIDKYHSSDVVLDGKEKKSTQPPLMLDLAGLSSMLASRGYDPGEVLSTYQKMYEDHVVSYPRTDDKYITKAQFEELRGNRFKIADVVGIDKDLLTHTSPRAKHVKDSATHGANRPDTNIPRSLDDLRKYGASAPAIYSLLAKNALAIFGEDYEYEHQTGHLKDYPEFVGTSNIPLKAGYKAIIDVEKKTDDEAEGEQKDTEKPLGRKAEPFIYEGANPKPKNPTMKWLVGKGGQLEKYNVGTGATRTSTFRDVTDGKGQNAKMQLMKMSKKGVLSMTEIGDISYALLKGCYIASPEVTEKLLSGMDEVGEFKISENELISKITPLMVHDMAVMEKNAEAIEPQVYEAKEKTEKSIYAPTGEEVSFNKEWGGHTFTDDEIEKLLAGDEISFEAVSKRGKAYTARGTLKKQKYKGKTFWGFSLKTELPDEWCRHRFTDEEKEMLLSGKDVTASDFWSEKKKKTFEGTVYFKDGRIKLKVSIPIAKARGLKSSC